MNLFTPILLHFGNNVLLLLFSSLVTALVNFLDNGLFDSFFHLNHELSKPCVFFAGKSLVHPGFYTLNVYFVFFMIK